MDDILALDNQLCFALYGLSRKMTSLYRPLLKPLGLTYPQYLVMLVLWEAQGDVLSSDFPGVLIKQIGERLLLDTGTLTPLLKRLESQGMLSRSRAKDDEREVRVRLTDKGSGIKEKAKQVPMALVCQSPVPIERLVVLQQELMGLLREMDQ